MKMIVRSSLLLSTMLTLCGCNSDSIAITHPDQSLFKVKMQIPAVTLSTLASYDTVQLSAVAYRGNGAVIPEAVPTFIASDESFTVTESGLVTALSVTTNSFVVAQVHYDGVTRSDTTLLSIISHTAPPSPLTTFSIQAGPVVSVGENSSIEVTARDAGNVNLAPGIPVHFTTSDPSVATASRLGTVTAQDPKRQVMVYATTMVYGVIKTDSVEVSTDYPLSVIVAAERKITSTDTLLVFHPHRIYIRAGGHVAFFNVTIGGIFNTQPLDVVFSDPSAAHSGPIIYPPGEGNIAPFVGTDWTDWARARTFVTPGTYTFRSNRYGTTGTIVVQ